MFPTTVHKAQRLNVFLGKEAGQRLPRLVSGTLLAPNQTLPHPSVSNLSERVYTCKKITAPKTCQPQRWNRSFTEASGGVRGSPLDPAETAHVRGCERRKPSSVVNHCPCVCPPRMSNCVSSSHYRNSALQKPTSLLPLQRGQ